MSLIHLSETAYEEIKEALAASGHRIAPVRPSEAVSEPLASHADIFLCKLGVSPKSPVFRGDKSRLGPVYPKDVPYNAVVTERFMICNTKTAAPELINAAKELYPGIAIIDVRQGYTKCNTVVVDESHFITEDAGIYRAICAYREKALGILSKTDASVKAEDACIAEGCCKQILPECLLIRPGYVKLPGYDRGFIGGASGRIGSELWFNGDISTHPDFSSIKSFTENCGLKLRYISGKELLDIGSIIEEG